MKQTIILVFCLIEVIYSQQVKNICLGRKDCSSCLLAGGDCAFCQDEDFTKGYSRCDKAKNLKDKCTAIMDIQGTVSKDANNGFTHIVQVRPQKVALNLRPGQTKQFKLRIKPAVNFPAHLYYLMDMSKSMEDDLLKLRTLGKQIAKGISSVTKKYKLAFGSFVDKTVAPFIQLGKLDEPCELTDGTKCIKTFDYRHVFDFDNNTNKFEKAVNQQNISGNLDTPEGGFDALMQIATCTNILKWEPVEQARRIVVFVTDASPHIAGDGRIGGIIAPNDGKCHLGKVGDYYEYSKANDLDYPSLSMLKEKLDENSIIPIMAVTNDVKSIYDNIAAGWKDIKAVTGILEKDSSNIVGLIKEKYSEIIRTLAPNLSTKTLKGVVVKFRSSKCEAPAVVSDDGKVCSKIEEGNEYIFDVSVTATECPDDPKAKRIFIIDSGFGKVEVDLTMVCDCECETQPSDNDSVKCNGKGTFKCGICYCNENWFGKNCQCNDETQADDSQCKKDNNTDVVCSTQGACICGECQCNVKPAPDVISGKFCQCNNFGCPQFGGEVCGGSKRGTCDCGICKCKDLYLGDNCGEINCTLTSKKCQNNGNVCGGNGNCKCNQCVCHKGYGGPFCEECVSCPRKCPIYKDCVQCRIWGEGGLAKSGCAGCEHLDIVKVNKTGEADCEYQDENLCWFHFDITNEDGNDTIRVQKDKQDCVEVINNKINILPIILGIIGGLILLALILLLLWKLLTTAYDNYEYQMFLKEKQNNKWVTRNPIYTIAQTSYNNPTYTGK